MQFWVGCRVRAKTNAMRSQFAHLVPSQILLAAQCRPVVADKRRWQVHGCRETEALQNRPRGRVEIAKAVIKSDCHRTFAFYLVFGRRQSLFQGDARVPKVTKPFHMLCKPARTNRNPIVWTDSRLRVV